MNPQYIALVDEGDGPPEAGGSRFAGRLFAMGLQYRHTAGPITLFATTDMPTLALPDGGLVVGNIFPRRRVALNADALLRHRECSEQIRRDILENYWGDYLIFQPVVGDARGFSVTRDPSGSVSCVYDLKRDPGFVTSDISLATELGIYARQIDWDYIAHCLTYPHFKAHRTGLVGVRELLPGCSLHRSGTDVSLEQAWSPWDFVAPSRRHTDFHEAAAEVRNAVTSVVDTWARTDRSILLELSGGLDSSIVAASLAHTQARVVCSTLVTQVPGADERQYAGLMARELGSALHTEPLNFDAAGFDFELPRHSVTPRIGPLQHAISEVMSAAGDVHNVASHYSGAGGDTVFCYLRTAAPAADAFKERGFAGAIAAVRDLSKLHQCTLWKAGHLVLRKLGRGAHDPYKPDCSFLVPTRVAATREEHPWFFTQSDALPGDRERVLDLVGTQVFRDSTLRTRPLRMPLLSQPVIEACLKSPCWMWIAGGQNRAVARSAFADLLPEDILSRRSKGTFRAYLGSLYQRNKHSMRDFLLTGHLLAHGLLDADVLRRFVDGDTVLKDRSFARVLELCRVENWVRHQV